MPTLTLEAIQQRISQRDSELQTLRRELEARRIRLESLTQRKADLQAKLQQIEAEMAAVVAGARRPAPAASKPATKKPAPKRVGRSKPGHPTLANLIVAILKEVGRPLTVLQLTQKVKDRGFPTKSKAPHKLVGKNVYALAAKNILQKAADLSGFVVAVTKGAAKPTTKAAGPKPKAAHAPTAGSAHPTAKSKPSVNGAAKSATGHKGAPQRPLREVLTQVLRNGDKPMTGSDLAKKALQAGYHTTSKKFTDSVWTMLSQMDNVEHVKGEGYRLKRGK